MNCIQYARTLVEYDSMSKAILNTRTSSAPQIMSSLRLRASKVRTACAFASGTARPPVRRMTERPRDGQQTKHTRSRVRGGCFQHSTP